MIDKLSILKGLHPGIALDRELKDRKIPKGRFALSINEFPQTLGAITKGKRNMNTNLAMRIEEALGIEEGYFMTLQVFYEIKQEKRRRNAQFKPDLTKLKRILFWDTKMENIDWIQHKRYVINRVFERGDDMEKAEIIRFYGQQTIDEVLADKHSTWQTNYSGTR